MRNKKCQTRCSSIFYLRPGVTKKKKKISTQNSRQKFFFGGIFFFLPSSPSHLLFILLSPLHFLLFLLSFLRLSHIKKFIDIWPRSKLNILFCGYFPLLSVDVCSWSLKSDIWAWPPGCVWKCVWTTGGEIHSLKEQFLFSPIRKHQAGLAVYS